MARVRVRAACIYLNRGEVVHGMHVYIYYSGRTFFVFLIIDFFFAKPIIIL